MTTCLSLGSRESLCILFFFRLHRYETFLHVANELFCILSNNTSLKYHRHHLKLLHHCIGLPMLLNLIGKSSAIPASIITKRK